jgi:hypothetical protein
MPFPEPETALASTIDAGAEGTVAWRKNASLGGRKGPSTTVQSLTRRLNNSEEDLVVPDRSVVGKRLLFDSNLDRGVVVQ